MSSLKHLVIGADGVLGRSLCAELEYRGEEFAFTSRRESLPARSGRPGSALRFMLGESDPKTLPYARRIYVVAAITSVIACQRDPVATWRVNVDAPLAIARLVPVSFDVIVYVSSDAVEFCGHLEYGRQKAQVEAALALHPRCTIVRPTRFNASQAPALAKFMLDAATGGGLYRWAP